MSMSKADKALAEAGLREAISQETPIYTLTVKRNASGSKWIKVFVVSSQGRILDMTWNCAKAFGFRLKNTDHLAILVDYEEDAYRAINALLFDQSKPLPAHIKL